MARMPHLPRLRRRPGSGLISGRTVACVNDRHVGTIDPRAAPGRKSHGAVLRWHTGDCRSGRRGDPSTMRRSLVPFRLRCQHETRSDDEVCDPVAPARCRLCLRPSRVPTLDHRGSRRVDAIGQLRTLANSPCCATQNCVLVMVAETIDRGQPCRMKRGGTRPAPPISSQPTRRIGGGFQRPSRACGFGA